VRHEQTHAQERHWECDVPGCKKKFKLKEYLGSQIQLFSFTHSPLPPQPPPPDIHKKTWHARHEIPNSNDYTLRTMNETSGNNDTTYAHTPSSLVTPPSCSPHPLLLRIVVSSCVKD
jgi:hypothetical protein